MQEERGASLTARRVPRLAWISLLVALAVVVLDQLTKVWALRALTPGESVPVIGDLIRLTIIRNPGAAFSIGNQATWLLTLVAVVVLAVVLGSLRRLGHLGWALCLGLLLGGAVGNLLDRLIREPGIGRGHVVDFIDYGGLFIGNVADIAIVAAALSIAVLAWKGIGLDGSREARESGGVASTDSTASRADDA
ncbi:signal peptidase II [Nostocoides sp. F2B08]|uniref:signal peptidase II n=1 Tax=Nostocoides sp. F2B08 TaxID=2653936 RepID=UPI001262F311|nr:signal peptidase II [Tetrasphaera sp. F2B08]KAB7741064.1 signal peptidase II [Tetrasphaera sp. F2B08]